MKTFKVIYTLIYENGKTEMKETILKMKKWDDVDAISDLFWKRDWEGDVSELVVENKKEIK